MNDMAANTLKTHVK